MAEKTMNEKEKYLDEIEDKIRTIGVLTSGGDAPGMNAAIRAVVRRALAKGLKVRGIRRGYHGLLKEEIIDLTARDVSDIVQRGGTILQTARCKTMRTEEGQQKAYSISTPASSINSSSEMIGTPSSFAFLFLEEADSTSLLIR